MLASLEVVPVSPSSHDEGNEEGASVVRTERDKEGTFTRLKVCGKRKGRKEKGLGVGL